VHRAHHLRESTTTELLAQLVPRGDVVKGHLVREGRAHHQEAGWRRHSGWSGGRVERKRECGRVREVRQVKWRGRRLVRAAARRSKVLGLRAVRAAGQYRCGGAAHIGELPDASPHLLLAHL
jgi:hypothetical protein